MDNIIKFSDIKLNHLKLYHVNKNHCNSIIYYDKKKDHFITIYNKSNSNLYLMFQNNSKYIKHFIPFLVNIIVDNDNLLKGYTMLKGKTINNFLLMKYLKKNKELLFEFMNNSDFYYCDFTAFNIIQINGNYGFIDLDSFTKIRKQNQFWNIKVDWYINEVAKIANII